jgi:hypothetical protein
MILAGFMRWLFHKRRCRPISLYLVAPREVMLAARQKMLIELSRRLKNQLKHIKSIPVNVKK